MSTSEISDKKTKKETKKETKEKKTKKFNPDKWGGKNLEHHAQILLRPDSYIRNHVLKERKDKDFIFDEKTQKIVCKKFISNMGLEQIFLEVLINAIDNKWRTDKIRGQAKKEKSDNFYKDLKSYKIKINVEKSGKTSVWNDGYTIPIDFYQDEKKGKTNLYNPEYAFGVLLTGENYDDSEERRTAGRNGYGSKLTNIFSKKFRVDTYNKKQKILYYQKWSRNMYDKEAPVITSDKDEVKKLLKKISDDYEDNKNGFTMLTWTPDFERFQMTEYTDEVIAVFKRYAYEAAMVSGLEITFNGEEIKCDGLEEYARMFIDDDCKEIYSFEFSNKNIDTQCVIIPWDEFKQISFTNGCYNSDGGIHVEAWSETVFRPLVEAFKNKGKRKAGAKTKAKSKAKSKAKNKAKTDEKSKINIKHIKDNFMIFVNVMMDKPEFEGQYKERLVAPSIDIDKEVVTEDNVKDIIKWDFVKRLELMVKSKAYTELKKIENKRGERVVLPNYDRANLVGKDDCILLIVEGLSAKEAIVSGLNEKIFGKKGRDYIGIYPIKGKFLNCRNSSPTQLMKNKEFVGLMKVLGLQIDKKTGKGVDYTEDSNFDKLLYKKVVIITDADLDGIHITGLLVNMFSFLFPSLFDRDFLYKLDTPILRINLGGKNSAGNEFNLDNSLMFYNIDQGRKFVEENPKYKNKIKYFKGLGTYKGTTFKSVFGKKLVKLVKDENADKNIIMAFDKKKADARKDALVQYEETDSKELKAKRETGKEFVKKTETETYITNFIKFDLVRFWIDDCKRSIPCIYDGMKESHRKIFYGCKLKKLKYTASEVKVSQLSGYIAEKTNYHHGEEILTKTIKTLGRNYCGTNNIPILAACGQFGNRTNGEGSAGRYIFTKLEQLSSYIFREEDDDLLTYLEDDGDVIEPEFYIPIIPMILVNPSEGIGSGWSTNIPAHNPKDLIEWIRRWLNGQERNSFSPWYRGFKGEIVNNPKKKGSFITRGVYESVGKKGNKYKISEIPIGEFIDPYKDKLELMVSEGKLKDIENHSSEKDDPNCVDFTIMTNDDSIEINSKNLGLESNIAYTNMVLFVKNFKLKKFTTTDDIIEEFCKVRFEYYTKRKLKQIEQIETELKYTSNIIRFLKEIINETLIVKNKNTKQLIEELEKRGYDKKVSEKKKVKAQDVKDEDGDEKGNAKGSYTYLTGISIGSQTIDKIAELEHEKEQLDDKLNKVKTTTEKQTWETELDEFEKEYEKWLKNN